MDQACAYGNVPVVMKFRGATLDLEVAKLAGACLMLHSRQSSPTGLSSPVKGGVEPHPVRAWQWCDCQAWPCTFIATSLGACRSTKGYFCMRVCKHSQHEDDVLQALLPIFALALTVLNAPPHC